MDDDLSVVTLPVRASLSQRVQVICLPASFPEDREEGHEQKSLVFFKKNLIDKKMYVLTTTVALALLLKKF